MDRTLLNNYEDFVKTVTSDASNNVDAMIARLKALEAQGVNISLLMTAAIGLGSEGGEFQEIVKKMVFQGKEYTEDNRFHMKRELGDILWYWANASRALGYNPNEIVAENVEKLKSRYPGGQFNVFYSENRKEGDL